MKYFVTILCLLLCCCLQAVAQRTIHLTHQGAATGSNHKITLTQQTAAPTSGHRKITLPDTTSVVVPLPASTFTLTSTARTSAGVYDSATGKLIRTLWNGVTYPAGTYDINWNGLDDDSNSVSATGKQFKVLSNNVSYTWLKVIGNNSDSLTGATVWHPWDCMRDMVQVGRYMYCAMGYSETYKRPAQVKFDTANPHRKLDINSMVTNSAGGQQSKFVCTDGTRIYFGGGDAGKPQFSFVFAINASGEAQTTFSSGTAYTTKLSFAYTSVIDTFNAVGVDITGLAVQKNGTYLFVARSAINQIDVVNKTTGAIVRMITYTAPSGLKTGDDNSLWIISNQSTVSKYTINSDGTLSAAVLSLAGITKPIALGISQDSTTVAVADMATWNVKAYNPSTGASTWTLGQSGGYVNSPAIANDKFLFRTLFNGGMKPGTFLSFLSDGGLWVGDAGTNRYQHFSSDRTFYNNIQYIALSRCTNVNPADSNHVYTDFVEYQINYTDTSWQAVNNWAGNISEGYYSQFVNMRNPVSITYSGVTHKYAVLQDSIAARRIVELTATGLRITTATMIRNEKMYIDGTIGSISTYSLNNPTLFKRKTLNSIDGSGNPSWNSYTTVASTPNAVSGDPVSRNVISGAYKGAERTSTNIYVSFDEHLPVNGSSKWHLGAVKAGDSTWLWKTAKRTGTAYKGNYPTDGGFDDGNGTNYPGGFVTAIDRSIFWNHHGEFWKGGQTNMWQQVWDDGLLVGTFGAVPNPALSVRDVINAPAGMAGNTYTGGFVKVGSDYFLYHCDESWHGGIHMWKISNLSSISEQTVAAKIN